MQHQLHPKYRADIDGLRTVAVLSVLFFHAFPQYVSGGFVGVDIFFVISGYLISTIIYSNLKGGSFSFKDFYFRRIRRIFPALFLILACTFIFGWFFLTPREYEILNQQIAAGAGFVSNFIFWRQSGYFDIAAEKKPLLHLWSLAVEEQFYIFWPLFLWLAWKSRINLLLTTIVLALVSFGLNISKIGPDPIGTFYAPQTRFWELLAGACLAYLVLNPNKTIGFKNKKTYQNCASILGLSLILFSVIWFDKSLPFPGWWALLPVLGAILLISAGPEGFINQILLKNRLMVAIGLISYPLYLWHWPILSLARIYYGISLSAYQAFLALGLSFLLAWITFWFVERRIRYSKDGGVKLLLLIISVVVMGVAGYFVKESNGLASRFSVEPLVRTSQLTGCDNVVKEDIFYPCTFGNPNSAEIILIYGDSHAGHLTGALNESLGNRYKFIFLGSGDCFMSRNEGQDKEQMCQRMWGEVKKLRHQRLYALVHAQRWDNFNESSAKETMEFVFKASGLKPDKIAVVGSLPDVDLDCEIANYYIPSRMKSCVVLQDQYEANESFINETKKLKKPSNLIFVYPYEKLCPDGKCKVLEGSTSNYWDDRHMSREGAKKAIPDLVEFLSN